MIDRMYDTINPKVGWFFYTPFPKTWSRWTFGQIIIAPSNAHTIIWSSSSFVVVQEISKIWRIGMNDSDRLEGASEYLEVFQKKGGPSLFPGGDDDDKEYEDGSMQEENPDEEQADD
jgi:hypothetical protein